MLLKLNGSDYMVDINDLISKLVEVEYINIRIELYINLNDDIKSKLSSGLILNNNLIYAYREKIKGLIKYIDIFQKNIDLFSVDYYEKVNSFVRSNIDIINKIILGMNISFNNDNLPDLILKEQEMYLHLIINNNQLLNDLADNYLKNIADEDDENVLQIKQFINESNQNKEQLLYIYNGEKKHYLPNLNFNNINLKKRCLFHISEIEKAISFIEESENKSRKNINELFVYYNEILKLKHTISQIL